MIQFIHIGDFHAAPGPRNADRYRALDQIIAEGLALPALGAWFWPGDLNHGRMAIEDRNAIAARLIRMADFAPVVICDGNHDLHGDLAVFGKLKATWPIEVVSQPSVVRVKLASDHGDYASIFVLPYPTKAGLVAQGTAHDQIVTEAGAALDAIFRQAAVDLQIARDCGDLTLMIGHVNVAGSIASVGQPNIGKEIEIDQTHLDRLGHIPKLLNHIHKAQRIAGAHYAGSVCRLDWGEIEAKGYLEVQMGLPDTPGGVFVTRPIDVRPMYHVEGQLTRDAFAWQVTAGPLGAVQPRPESWRGAEVRCRYTFKQSEKNILSTAPILAEFAEAAKLEIEPIADLDRALRAPAVAAARTLGEKVQAWCVETGLTASVGVLQKLAQLEHGDHLQLMNELQAKLSAIEAGERKETVAA